MTKKEQLLILQSLQKEIQLKGRSEFFEGIFGYWIAFWPDKKNWININPVIVSIEGDGIGVEAPFSSKPLDRVRDDKGRFTPNDVFIPFIPLADPECWAKVKKSIQHIHGFQVGNKERGK